MQMKGPRLELQDDSVGTGGVNKKLGSRKFFNSLPLVQTRYGFASLSLSGPLYTWNFGLIGACWVIYPLNNTKSLEGVT